MAKKSLLSLPITEDFIKKTGGDDALKLVKICEKKGNKVTDEEIGKQLKHLKITEIRTILNRLHYRGIACYAKTRNNKTGWYSYTWDIKERRIAELILEEQAQEVARLEKTLDFEKNYVFFGCKNVCENVPFEIAAEYNFMCPKCGKKMTTIDNKKRLKNIKKQIETINTELQTLGKSI